MGKYTVTRGLLKELFPGRCFSSLNTEEKRVYRQEWARRNPDRIRVRKAAKRASENARRRDRLKNDPEWREKRRSYEKAWNAKNRHRHAAYYRNYRLRAEYGLTELEYLGMSARQGGLCALCGKKPLKKLAIDHDHATGEVRDLLCHNCNMVLGHCRDNPALMRKAATYIERHRRKVANDGHPTQLPLSA